MKNKVSFNWELHLQDKLQAMSFPNSTSPVQLKELTNGFGHFTSDLYQVI